MLLSFYIYTYMYICSNCGAVVHKHCEYRSPLCKAQIESGSYVTMSRKKIVKALDDLDDLAHFRLHKISLLKSDGSSISKFLKLHSLNFIIHLCQISP